VITLQKVFSDTVWRRLAVAFVLFAVPVFMFVELAEEVREKETQTVDEGVLLLINGTASPQLDAAMAGLTHLGGVWAVALITVGLAMVLWQKQLLRMAALLAVTVGGAATINILLKALFQRDRPELWERIVTENSYSFPSGHAMASSALALGLMVIFWPTRWRWLAVVIGCIYMVIVGFTRLYLGVHYPTDVVAGWLVSAAWVTVAAVTLQYPRWAKPEAKQLDGR